MLGLAAGGTTLALHPFGLLRGSQAYTGPFEPGGMVFSGGNKQRLPWAYSSLALDKVVATGPASVWVISTEGRKSRIEHWNGSRRRLVHAPFGSNDALVGFSATAWNDAWAVGSYGLGGNNIAKYSHALAAHWNGRRWQITPVPNPRVDNNSAALVDVSAARPDDAWAIGESQQLNLRGSNGADGISAPVPYFLRWDGQNWRVMAGATPVMGVGSLAATKDGSAWAIGACVFDNVVMRWTKGAWAVASHPPEHWPSNRSLPPGSRRGPSCTSIPAAGS
jgi:hypothetical protein